MIDILERLECDCDSNNCTFKLAAAEIERLTARVKELEEGLTPFASIQSEMGNYVGYPDSIIVRIEASVGELRRARALLSPAPAEGGE